MRFRSTESPPPFLNRRDQWRLFGWMALLLLVLVAIDVARKPSSWNWFFLLTRSSPAVTPVAEIDYRVHDTTSELLPLDTFLAEADAIGVAPATPVDSAPPALTQLPQDWLQGVRDQQLGRLRAEDAIFRRVLDYVAEQSPEQLFEVSEEGAYRVINAEPAAVRGRLFHLTGTVRRIAPYAIRDAAEPDLQAAQAWMFTEDSGDNPWVVLLPALPTGWKWGDQLNRDIRIAGYFIKRFGYPTETGFHVAPLLIGRQVALPVIDPVTATAPAPWWVAGLICTVLGAFAAVWLWFWRSDRRFAGSRAAQIARTPPALTLEAASKLDELAALDLPKFPALPRDQGSEEANQRPSADPPRRKIREQESEGS